MQVKVAKEDITTFKHVRLSEDRKTWYGIYQKRYEAPTNEVLRAEGRYPDVSGPNHVTVGAGMFHSCADLNSMVGWSTDFRVGSFVVLCKIPKGTKYYMSKVPNDICSEQIIVTDIIILGDGANRPKLEPKLLRKAIVEVVELNQHWGDANCVSEGKKYLHVKDDHHEVYLSLKNQGRLPWKEAIKKASEDKHERLPDADDWDLINKYRHQIDPMLREAKGDSLNDVFWSLSESNSHTGAWSYYGSSGSFFSTYKSYALSCRSVLALDS